MQVIFPTLNVNNVNESKSSKSSTEQVGGVNFSEFISAFGKDALKVIPGNDGSHLLNFWKKEVKERESKVPKKMIKTIYDLLADVELFENRSRHVQCREARDPDASSLTVVSNY